MTALLSIRDVSKAYPDGSGEIVVFEKASLEVEPGIHVAVYGKRRSGKSTLLRIAAGIDRPDSGAVVFSGRDLARLSGSERAHLLRSRLAYIAVSDWRPNPGETIVNHLALSLGNNGLTVHEAERRALLELERVGISGSRAHTPATQLSMGDRTSVMLARALAREPWLIVIDDPVLTPNHYERDRLYLMLRTLSHERAISLLVASEDLPALRGFDVVTSISSRELCSSEGSATVVPFPTPPGMGPALHAGS